MAEQLICNQQVVGSSPITGSTTNTATPNIYGQIPERQNGSDCKSDVFDFGGSNPPLPTKRNLNRTTYVRVGFLFFYTQIQNHFKGVSFRQGNAFYFVLNKYLPLWNQAKNGGLCRESLLTGERSVLGYYCQRQQKNPHGALVVGSFQPLQRTPQRLLSRVPWNK